MSNIRICVLAEAELGGTGKAATIYATQLVNRGYDVDYLTAKGPRTEFLKLNRVRVIDAANSDADLYDYIVQNRPNIIHQHVPGYPVINHLYPALKRLPEKKRPKLIETNVFGRLEDPNGEKAVAFRMFVSMASAAQAFRRAHIADLLQSLNRHSVLYNPVLPSRAIHPADRNDFRTELGVSEREVLAVRVGRPGHKWASWECQAHSIARKKIPHLRLLVMEPPQWLTNHIECGDFGDGIIVRKETSDFDWLEQLYASADLMIHASDWGESFGYTIAEGMAAGLPVITRSTPWCDNAQVELVRNRTTGFVCWSVPEMARRLADLSGNQDERERMGSAARERILALADVNDEGEILNEVIQHIVMGRSLSKITERNARLLDFTKYFPRLERDTSESFKKHPLDFTIGSFYAGYRCLRSSVRAMGTRAGRLVSDKFSLN